VRKRTAARRVEGFETREEKGRGSPKLSQAYRVVRVAQLALGAHINVALQRVQKGVHVRGNLFFFLKRK
jgi:hypothetical protein